MKTFTTNHGHTIEAKSISAGIDKAVEKLKAIFTEKVGCRVKLHSSNSFTVPRHKHVEAVQLVFVPDLPEFITRHMSSIPRIEVPFSIQANEPNKGEDWKVENTRTDGLPYLYRGEWDSIANQHAYFTTACGVVRSGKEPSQIIITQPRVTPGHMHGIMTLAGSSIGAVGFSATKLPKKSKAKPNKK